jgi:nucleotide-binding universal stress UspA family protein
MRKLLIGYDGSEHGDAAIDDLQRAGLPQNIEAVVLTVADVFLPPAVDPKDWGPSPLDERTKKRAEEMRARAMKAREEADALARRGAARLQQLFPSWAIRVETDVNWPGWGIILKAEEWQADLVVIGGGKHSFIERIKSGSVLRKVVGACERSVRVGRPSSRHSEPSVRIIIGLDGSPDAEFAMEAMAGRVWPGGSEAHLISVLDTRLSLLTPSLIPRLARWASAADSANDQAWVDRMMKAASDKLQNAGLKISCEVVRGDPSQRLLDAAIDWQADWIVVGARGLSGIERFLIGSVAADVAVRANCSVEVVRAPAIRFIETAVNDPAINP